MSTTVELVRANERYARLRAAVEALAAEWESCWCPAQQHPDEDPRRQDCPVHGDSSCQHMASGTVHSLRALLAAVNS